MNKLKLLFATIGTLVVGGTTYTVALLKAGVTIAEAVDAGLLQLSVPARVECTVRIAEACRVDAGIANVYQHVQMRAQIVRDAGAGQPPIIGIDIPERWKPCVRLAGDSRNACQILENGTCTPGAVCNAGSAPQVQQSPCACRRPDAGLCRLTLLDGGLGVLPDGGSQLAPLGATLSANRWTGPGCVRKFCGPEIAGEQGLSWNPLCPEK